MERIDRLRQEVMRVACKNNKGHIAPSLSCLDILAVLKYEPQFRNDTIILSKAHGGYGLYAIEADKGEIPREKWENFDLPGCYDELGSLGHGIPLGVGLAWGRRLQNPDDKRHVFVIVGDGELQEGSNWEALAFMHHHHLKNITIVVDLNRFQAIANTEEVLCCRLYDRFAGWGFIPRICQGHDEHALIHFLSDRVPILIAYTTKGKGFPAMENQAKFHYRVPTEEERGYDA